MYICLEMVPLMSKHVCVRIVETNVDSNISKYIEYA